MISAFVILFFISVVGVIFDVRGADNSLPTVDTIFAVIENDDVQTAKQMIEKNILRINEPFGGDNRTALHIAVFNRSKQVVELLLAYGANPHIADFNCKTPVYYSADALARVEKNKELNSDEKMKAYSIFELLIRHSIQIDRNKYGSTIIHLLSSVDETAVTNQYLEKVFKNNHYKNAINYHNCTYYTPLHCAVAAGNIETVKILLKHGASVARKTKDGMTSVHIAAKCNDGDIMEQLLEWLRTNNLNKELKMQLLGWAATKQTTPLHVAACYNSSDVAQRLLDEGVSVNACDKENQTPLHCAVQHMSNNMVMLLLRNGAKCTVLNTQGQTPLHYAALYRVPESVAYLALYDASINATDGNGCTPLLMSVRQRYTQVSDPRPNHDISNMLRTMHTLYSRGADPMIRSERYGSIIECAAQTGIWAFLHALLLYYSYLQEDKKCIPVEQMVKNYLPADLLEFMKNYQIRWGSLKYLHRTAKVDELLESTTPEIIEQFFNALKTEK